MRHVYHDHLDLSQKEQSLIENHSLLNLFNILELQLAGLSVELPEAGIQKYFQFCLDTLLELSRMDVKSRFPVLMANCHTLRTHLEELKQSHPGSQKIIEGLIETTNIGHARLVEFEDPKYAWRTITRDSVQDSLKTFLLATSTVSGDRFGFAFSPEPPRPRAYWIDFQIRVENGDFNAPAAINDTIRDLVSNSRKYSEPGSAIRIRIDPIDDDGLRVMISDEGIGIPEDELPDIIQFGYRATNAIDRRTMGGGIGLTKAFQLCRRYNGQFIIDSEIGKGTTVSLTLFPPS